jgi:hypothetical protein
MSYKKLLLAGSILILGVNVVASGAYAQANKNSARDADLTRTQLRAMFMDQDCDGINDKLRDHDNDGVPNCQDPDWAPPKDGTGFQEHKGKGGGNGNGTGWNNASFRGQGRGFAGSLGTGVCDGTGPKGRAVRRGGR